jgi:S-phase kinase-associated protein 1
MSEFTVSTPIHLISQEGESFEISLENAIISELVKTMIDEEKDEEEIQEIQEIPLPAVKSAILAKIVEFMNHYKTEKMTKITKPIKSNNMSEVVQEWYANFVNVEQEVLFELTLVANFMDIHPLLDLTCAKVASMVKGKEPEEIRHIFNITENINGGPCINEDEAQVRAENRWCEDA